MHAVYTLCMSMELATQRPAWADNTNARGFFRCEVLPLFEDRHGYLEEWPEPVAYGYGRTEAEAHAAAQRIAQHMGEWEELDFEPPCVAGYDSGLSERVEERCHACGTTERSVHPDGGGRCDDWDIHEQLLCGQCSIAWFGERDEDDNGRLGCGCPLRAECDCAEQVVYEPTLAECGFPRGAY